MKAKYKIGDYVKITNWRRTYPGLNVHSRVWFTVNDKLNKLTDTNYRKQHKNSKFKIENIIEITESPIAYENYVYLLIIDDLFVEIGQYGISKSPNIKLYNYLLTKN